MRVCVALQGQRQRRQAPARSPSKPFGTADGQPVDLYTLRNGRMEARIMNLRRHRCLAQGPRPDRAIADVVLGYDNLADYIKERLTLAP